MRCPLLITIVLAACTPQGFDALQVPLAGAPPPRWCTPGVAARVLPGGQAWSNLQDALASASDIARVEVCPGVHYGGFSDFQVRTRIQLVGVTGNPADVLLDGANTDLILNLRNTAQIGLSSITLQNGIDGDPNENNGAFAPGFAAALWIDNVVFQDNASNSGTGALSSDWVSDLRVTRTVFRRNIGYRVGAAAFTLYRGLGATFSDVSFEDNEVSFGGPPALAIVGTRSGAAFGLPRPIYSLDRMRVTQNVSSPDGDPTVMIGAVDGGYDLIVRDGTFEGNANSHYGALLAQAYDTQDLVRVRLEDTWFTDNVGTMTSALYMETMPVSFGATTGELRMTGGGFLRNSVDPNLADSATLYWYNAWRMGFRDVDFGSGADANVGRDLNLCNQDYGPGTFGVVDTSIQNHQCLSWPP